MSGFHCGAAAFLVFATTRCSGLQPTEDSFCSLYGCRDGDPDGSATGGDAGIDALTSSHANPWWCEVNGIAMTVVPPPAAPTNPTIVRYYLPIIDFSSALNNTPSFVPNVDILGCQNSNPTCAGDAGVVPTVHAPTSAKGYGIDLPYGFSGGILINSPGYIPTEYFFGGPLVGEPDGGVDTDGTPVVYGLYVTPLLESAAEPFFAAAGLSPIPGTGVFAPRLLDCNGNRAAGTSLSVTDPNGGQPFTLVNNLPLFHDPPLPTDSRGVTGYFNIPPGTYPVAGVTPDGGLFGVNTPAVVVANTVTIIEIRTDNQGELGK